MKESRVWQEMLLRAGKIPGAIVRIMRNNVGTGWAGNRVIKITPSNRHDVWLNPGDVVVRQGRPLHAGLAKGSGDGIGWSSVEITPDMVGRTVAVFTSAETKKTTGGRVSTDQKQWFEQVRLAGGIAVIVRDPDDLERAVHEYLTARQ